MWGMSGEDLDVDCLSIKERTAHRGRSPRRIFLSRRTLEAIVFHSPPPARALLLLRVTLHLPTLLFVVFLYLLLVSIWEKNIT